MFGDIASSVQAHLSDLPWADWLPRRRWFVRRPGAAVPHLRDVVLLGPCAACFVEAGPDEYFVPLVASPDPAADGLVDQDGVRWIDGLEDPVALREIVVACLGEGVGPRHRRIAGRVLDRDALSASSRGQVRTGTADQTNSWALVGDTFVKVFRRLEAGGNLDVEVLEALAGRGELSVPRLRGVLEVSGPAGSRVLAAFQQAVPHERNAWEQACADVAAAARGDAGDIGIWGILGARTAQLHLALAQVFPVRPSTEDDGLRVADGMARLAREILGDLAAADRGAWTDSVKTRADAVLAGSVPLVRDLGAALPAGILLQRVHGDFHLGQVLRSGDDWTILDFEGEPARTPAERRAPAPAAKDVSGMLRSFDYASLAGLPDATDPEAQERVGRWRLAARESFLQGYFAVPGIGALWPADPAGRASLLDRYEAEKAFYELRYELAHRPDWLAIPLGGLVSLAKAAP